MWISPEILVGLLIDLWGFHRRPLVPAWGFPSERTRALSCREAREARCPETIEKCHFFIKQKWGWVSVCVWNQLFNWFMMAKLTYITWLTLANCWVHEGYNYSIHGASKPKPYCGADLRCCKMPGRYWVWCLHQKSDVCFLGKSTHVNPFREKYTGGPVKCSPAYPLVN